MDHYRQVLKTQGRQLISEGLQDVSNREEKQC